MWSDVVVVQSKLIAVLSVMAYGYKRKRRYSRRPTYRRRAFRRGGRGFASRGRGRSLFAPRTPGAQRGLPRTIVRALKRAAADPGSSLAEYLNPNKLQKVFADVKDHASRFVNPFGVSSSEAFRVVNHPSFPHVVSLYRDLQRGDYVGAARNAWTAWHTRDGDPSPYSRSTDIVPFSE